jgi:hypothetical protein
MQLKSARLQLAALDEGAVTARTAGIITVVGCVCAILGAFLPWGEKALFGLSISNAGLQSAGILLAGFAVISVCIAGPVLLRRPATAAIAIILILLALAQLGLAIWNGVNIVQAIAESDSRMVAIRTIGTGAFLGAAGALITLAGGIMAWTKRALSTVAAAEGA